MATPTLVSFTGQGFGAANGTTGAIDTTGATALRVVAITESSTAPTITDSKSNSWTQDGASTQISSAFGAYVFCFRATTNNVGSGHTFSGTGTFAITLFVFAVGPSAGGSLSLTTWDPVADASSPYTSNPVTPSQAEALLLAFGATNGSGSPVTQDWSSSSFTERAAVTDHNSFWGGAIATRAVSSIAAYTASFTDNSTSPTNSVLGIMAVTESAPGTYKYFESYQNQYRHNLTR